MTFTKYKQISQAKESEINDFYLLHIIFFCFPFQNNIKKERNIIILTWKGKKRKMELDKAPFIQSTMPIIRSSLNPLHAIF